MKTIIVTKPFKFAHEGIRVEEFEPSSEPIETTDECADLAVAEKWAKFPRQRNQAASEQAPDQAADQPADQAAAEASPEAAAEAGAPEVKAD